MRIASLFLFCLLFLHCGVASGNAIDSLKTNDDVDRFVNEKVLKSPKSVALFYIPGDDTLAKQKAGFTKVDLNKDGRTDLVINARYLIVVVDKGNGQYAYSFPSSTPFDECIRNNEIKEIDGNVTLIVRPCSNFGNEQPSPDTLVWTGAGLMNYNAHPRHQPVQKLHFSTSGCFGSCPIFDLAFDSTGKADFHAERYNEVNNKPLKAGRYTGYISKTLLKQLYDAIDFVAWEGIKERYRVGWTDDQTVTLELTEGGKTIKVSDYGARGTQSLKSIYLLLFEAAETTRWKLVSLDAKPSRRFPPSRKSR